MTARERAADFFRRFSRAWDATAEPVPPPIPGNQVVDVISYYHGEQGLALKTADGRRYEMFVLDSGLLALAEVKP